MAREEATQNCSTSNGDSGGGGGGNVGRSYKKQKQKKVPQRGLGVAQLEKIRLQEQQKKDGPLILPSASPITPTKASNLSVPISDYQSFSSSIPYRPDLSSPNSILRPQSTDFVNSKTGPLVNSVGWQSVSVQGHANLPKMWNSCEHNLEKESCGVDPGFAFRSSLNLPYESTPIWPLPDLMQRAQQYQHSSSSPLVNISSSSSSSSVLNFQMEPPSNQSYYGNYTPVRPEEEKMVGLKRSYPVSLDDPAGPSFHFKFPTPVVHHPISGSSDESISFGNGVTPMFNFNPANPNFRESSSFSNSISEPNLKKSHKRSEAFNGDFLTLAPPTTTAHQPNFKFKLPNPHNLPFPNQETFDFDSPPHQSSREHQVLQTGPEVSSPQQQFYSFLPPAIIPNTAQSPRPTSNCNGGEESEDIDLNLKL